MHMRTIISATLSTIPSLRWFTRASPRPSARRRKVKRINEAIGFLVFAPVLGFQFFLLFGLDVRSRVSRCAFLAVVKGDGLSVKQRLCYPSVDNA